MAKPQFKEIQSQPTHELTIKIRFKTDMVPGTYHEAEDFENLFRRKIVEVEAPWYALEISDSSIKKLTE